MRSSTPDVPHSAGEPGLGQQTRTGLRRKLRTLVRVPTNEFPQLGENPIVARRSYGTGSLFVESDGRGRESWYGKWYVAGQRVQRKLGTKRPRGSREGLTRAQAERELQRPNRL